jgi:hypothetical protein
MTYQAPQMTDQEREDFISFSGKRFLAAHAAGDYEDAQVWLAAQTKEVLARSPQQVEHMEQCYFSEQGAQARLLAKIKGLAA